MKWELIGCDRETGEERQIVIEADNEESARRRASRRGFLVSEIRGLDGSGDTASGKEVVVAGPLPQLLQPVPIAAPNIQIFVPQQRTASGPGIASLVLGILALTSTCLPLIGFVFAAIGLLLGFVGLFQDERTTSTSTAVAGVIMNFIALIPLIIVFCLFGGLAFLGWATH